MPKGTESGVVGSAGTADGNSPSTSYTAGNYDGNSPSTSHATEGAVQQGQSEGTTGSTSGQAGTTQTNGDSQVEASDSPSRSPGRGIPFNTLRLCLKAPKSFKLDGAFRALLGYDGPGNDRKVLLFLRDYARGQVWTDTSGATPPAQDPCIIVQGDNTYDGLLSSQGEHVSRRVSALCALSRLTALVHSPADLKILETVLDLYLEPEDFCKVAGEILVSSSGKNLEFVVPGHPEARQTVFVPTTKNGRHTCTLEHRAILNIKDVEEISLCVILKYRLKLHKRLGKLHGAKCKEVSLSAAIVPRESSLPPRGAHGKIDQTNLQRVSYKLGSQTMPASTCLPREDYDHKLEKSRSFVFTPSPWNTHKSVMEEECNKRKIACNSGEDRLYFVSQAYFRSRTKDRTGGMFTSSMVGFQEQAKKIVEDTVSACLQRAGQIRKSRFGILLTAVINLGTTSHLPQHVHLVEQHYRLIEEVQVNPVSLHVILRFMFSTELQKVVGASWLGIMEARDHWEGDNYYQKDRKDEKHARWYSIDGKQNARGSVLASFVVPPCAQRAAAVLPGTTGEGEDLEKESPAGTSGAVQPPVTGTKTTVPPSAEILEEMDDKGEGHKKESPAATSGAVQPPVTGTKTTVLPSAEISEKMDDKGEGHKKGSPAATSGAVQPPVTGTQTTVLPSAEILEEMDDKGEGHKKESPAGTSGAVQPPVTGTKTTVPPSAEISEEMDDKGEGHKKESPAGTSGAVQPPVTGTQTTVPPGAEILEEMDDKGEDLEKESPAGTSGAVQPPVTGTKTTVPPSAEILEEMDDKGEGHKKGSPAATSEAVQPPVTGTQTTVLPSAEISEKMDDKGEGHKKGSPAATSGAVQPPVTGTQTTVLPSAEILEEMDDKGEGHKKGSPAATSEGPARPSSWWARFCARASELCTRMRNAVCSFFRRIYTTISSCLCNCFSCCHTTSTRKEKGSQDSQGSQRIPGNTQDAASTDLPPGQEAQTAISTSEAGVDLRTESRILLKGEPAVQYCDNHLHAKPGSVRGSVLVHPLSSSPPSTLAVESSTLPLVQGSQQCAAK